MIGLVVQAVDDVIFGRTTADRINQVKGGGTIKPRDGIQFWWDGVEKLP